MTRKILPLLLCFVAFYAHAQTKLVTPRQHHTITIGASDFMFFNVHGYTRVAYPTFNFNYQYRFTEKFGARAGYSFWREGQIYKSIYSSVKFLGLFDANNPIGARYSSNSFRYFDIAGVYTKRFTHNHSINVFAGPTLCTYNDVHIKSISTTIQPNGERHIVAITTYEVPNQKAIGGMAGLEYNVTFWKDRINAGADVNGRTYPGKVPLNINYGLHIGFDF